VPGDHDPTDRAYAEALDAADPLASFRDEFVIADDDVCYLDGNSLGRLPKATEEALRRVVSEEWGTGLVRGWSRWIDRPAQVGDRLGRAVLGAGPGQVLVADSTTVNLYRLAAAALDARPDRGAIVADPADFPTDRYVLQGLAAERGRRLRRLRAVRTDAVARACAPGDVALVCLSHVDFRTAALAPLAEITAAAHAAGALVLWDLSHSAGVVPVSLDAAGVDLAAGCTYKYLFSGPGAPAWVYVRAEQQRRLRAPVWGWFAQRDQFAMGGAFRRADGVTGWLTGTPSVLGLAAVDEGIGLVERAGVEAIRAKSVALTELVIALFDAWLAPLGFELMTTRLAAGRGSHVAVRHPEAWRLCRVLAEQDAVIADFRPPDVVRLGFSPLTTRFAEAWTGAERLRRACAERRYERVESVRPRVT
jgi:kynureninase